MSEGQGLWLLFAALYLLECCLWLPEGRMLLVGPTGGWRLRRVPRLLELRDRRLTFLSLLPQAHLRLARWSLVPDPAGLVVQPDDGAPLLLPWSDLQPRAEGVVLHLDARQRWLCGDAASAREWCARLQRWRDLEDADREADFLALAGRSLEAAALREQAWQLAALTRSLRRLALLIGGLCFGVLAAVYRWLGDGPEVLALGAVLLLLLWVQAWQFWRRAVAVPQRFWKTLAIAFLPQHALRAADEFGPGDRREFHPLAAWDLLGESDRPALARAFWRQVAFRCTPGAAVQRLALERFFAAHQVSPETLEPVPVREAGANAYCPCCLAQFQKIDAHCADCGGLELRSFPAAS